MKLASTDLAPTQIGSVRTAQFFRSRVTHALPWGASKITICGMDATGHWIGDGMYGVDLAVTCENCKRSLLRKPQINFEITTHHQSGYLPADHSECQHRQEIHEACSDCFTTPCDACRNSECECESLGDSECDSVGGRWMDGLARDVSTGYSEEWDTFDPDTFAEAEGLFSPYTSATLFSPTSDLRGLEWRYDNEQRIPVARATRENDDESFTEYMIHIEGPGVTRAIRQVILAHIVEIGY